MVWLISQMAVVLLICACLAAFIGFWVRGWILSAERQEERARWQRKFENHLRKYETVSENFESLTKQHEKLRSDYQTVLNNERELYAQLDALGGHSHTPAVQSVTPIMSSTSTDNTAASDNTTTASNSTPNAWALSEAQGTPDNLKRIHGIGPKLAKTLNQKGIFHFWQLAALNTVQIEELAAALETFAGRIERDRWIEQAQELANP